ncbi:hypothetical protein [Spirosoma sordidisoli]|uniref:Uncharacterized protein n=1 Tax=Spirosoma sordidisoli TaxID=2502893 RepID=A0A4V1RWN4_9BACT|nr:hypothetical protein [Spirosoma sordidisoli]RYC70878.1 hypothetical protein EQG79_01620 [Spirosoma sordidisoli]
MAAAKKMKFKELDPAEGPALGRTLTLTEDEGNALLEYQKTHVACWELITPKQDPEPSTTTE